MLIKITKNFKIIIIIVAITLIVGFIFLTREKNTSNTSEEHSHGVGHTTAKTDFLKLPLKSPETKVALIPVVKDGVKEFQLSLDEIRWEYAKDKFVHAWAYNGQIPGPEIRVTEGDKIRVVVKNNLPVGTSIHWHGVHVENKADGIPGLTQYPIKPGETFTYEFTAKNAGTHFYHTHGSSHMDVVLQFDMGLSGSFIIEPKNPKKYDREYVYMLDEWEINPDGSNGALTHTKENGEHIHGKQNYNIFTINGRIFPDIDPLMVKDGEKVLVRLINAGTQAIHPMHTHGHSFKVVAIDGNPVPQVAQQMRDNLPILPGERYDIELIADNSGVWVFHCHDVHHAAAGMIIPFFYEGRKPLE